MIAFLNHSSQRWNVKNIIDSVEKVPTLKKSLIIKKVKGKAGQNGKNECCPKNRIFQTQGLVNELERNRRKDVFFTAKLFVFTLILRAGGMQFFNIPAQKSFIKKPDFFCSLSEKFKNLKAFQRKNFNSKNSLDT